MNCGINPKPKHFDALIQRHHAVGFLEFHTENLFAKGLAYQKALRLREDFEFSLHGVGLSLGSADGLSAAHLEKIKNEVTVFAPFLVSEHLSFSGFGGIFTPDLLPIPLNKKSLEIFKRNVLQFQDVINRQILIENPSLYFAPIGGEIPLGDFLNLLCEATGCGILLDVNNLEVCRQNIGTDPNRVIDSIKREYVGEIHIAGHVVKAKTNGQKLFLDNHGDIVSPAVWKLCAKAIKKFGDIPTLLEWDNDVPELAKLCAEADIANALKLEVLQDECLSV